jgi:DNA-binding Xre family transcriptional regulator
VLVIFSDANDEAIQYKKLEAVCVVLTVSDANDEAIQYKKLEAVCVVLTVSLRMMHKTSYCDAGPRTS